MQQSKDDDDDDAGDDDDVHDDEDGDEDEDESGLRPNRSAYVGRGNVQNVREARKRAGLSDGFPRSDPLLLEFASFLKMSGCAQNDISNKVKL